MEKALISTAHQNFIGFLMEGYDYRDAAEKAGFSRDHAERDVLGPCLIPAVRSMGKKYIRGRLDIEGAPAAYRFFMWTLRNPAAPWTARLEAAKVLLNHSIAAPKALADGEDNDKSPSDMSNDELRAFIRKGEQEAMQRGLLIDATPRQALDDLI